MGSGWNWFTFKQKLLSMNWSYRFSGFVFSILYFSPIHLWWRHQTEVVRVQVSRQCPPCPRPRPSQQTRSPHPRQPEYRDIGPDTSKLWTLWTLWTTCQCGVSLAAPHNSSKLRSPEHRCKCYNNNNMCLLLLAPPFDLSVINNFMAYWRTINVCWVGSCPAVHSGSIMGSCGRRR